MAASGVVGADEIVAMYKELLRGTGSRVTKKAETLMDELCKTLPLATKKGNTGLEEQGMESIGLDEEKDTVKKEETKESKNVKEEYVQLSIFDL